MTQEELNEMARVIVLRVAYQAKYGYIGDEQAQLHNMALKWEGEYLDCISRSCDCKKGSKS